MKMETSSSNLRSNSPTPSMPSQASFSLTPLRLLELLQPLKVVRVLLRLIKKRSLRLVSSSSSRSLIRTLIIAEVMLAIIKIAMVRKKTRMAVNSMARGSAANNSDL